MGDSYFLVKIKNYQRIRDATLKFEPGLNVIVGQSNNGKSAIIRAIQTALFNLPREGHVTLGETKCAVGVKYQGHEVIFRRDTKAASQVSYRIDGKILTKIGRRQPEEISELLGIREVELDEQKIRLNFQRQMEYPFLLDKTPAQLFKFIMQSAEEDNVMSVISTMKSDLAGINGRINAYEEARDSLKKAVVSQLGRYRSRRHLVPFCEKVIGVDSDVAKARSLATLVEKIRQRSSEVADIKSKLVDVSFEVGVLEGARDKLGGEIETLKNLSELTHDILSTQHLINSLRVSVNDARIDLDRYEQLGEIPNKLNTLTAMQSEYGRLKTNIWNIHHTNESIRDTVEAIAKVDSEVASLSGGIKEIKSKVVSIESAQVGRERLSNLVAQVTLAGNAVKVTRAKIAEVESDISTISAQLDEYEVCPFCGSPLGAGHEGHLS